MGREKGVSMKKIWLTVLSLLLFTMLLSGCAASTGVVKMSPDTYMIRVEDHAGVLAFHRGGLKTKAIQEANDFAESKNKVAIPLGMTEHPIGILGDWAAVEYQFRVVDKNDPEARRTSLVPGPNFVIDKTERISEDIHTKDTTEKQPDLYTELTKLDDLRKRRLITDAEFETQKKILLDKQR